MTANLPNIAQSNSPSRISSSKGGAKPTSQSVPCLTQAVKLPGMRVLRNPILGESYNLTRSYYPWMNNRRFRAPNSEQTNHERSVFTNRQHLMGNIYDISPDWVSDRSNFSKVTMLPRNTDFSWKLNWDHVHKPRYIHTVMRQNSHHHREDSVIGINDVRKATYNLPLPKVSAKPTSYKLPTVTNPMGPCLTRSE